MTTSAFFNRVNRQQTIFDSITKWSLQELSFDFSSTWILWHKIKTADPTTIFWLWVKTKSHSCDVRTWQPSVTCLSHLIGVNVSMAWSFTLLFEQLSRRCLFASNALLSVGSLFCKAQNVQTCEGHSCCEWRMSFQWSAFLSQTKLMEGNVVRHAKFVLHLVSLT